MLRNTFGLIYAGEQNINLRELVYLRTVGRFPWADVTARSISYCPIW